MVRTAPVALLAPAARVALVVLSVTVVVTAAGAAVQSIRGGTSLPDHPALPAAVTAPVTPPSAGGLRAAGGAAGVGTERTTFTLRELHDGEVPVARFTAFWEAELERIREAPCPGPTALGTTVVVVTVGATPPPHLAAEYPDFTPLLAAARAEVAAACA